MMTLHKSNLTQMLYASSWWGTCSVIRIKHRLYRGNNAFTSAA